MSDTRELILTKYLVALVAEELQHRAGRGDRSPSLRAFLPI